MLSLLNRSGGLMGIKAASIRKMTMIGHITEESTKNSTGTGEEPTNLKQNKHDTLQTTTLTDTEHTRTQTAHRHRDEHTQIAQDTLQIEGVYVGWRCTCKPLNSLQVYIKRNEAQSINFNITKNSP